MGHVYKKTERKDHIPFSFGFIGYGFDFGVFRVSGASS
jgi:hypothetical protein